MKKKTTVKKPNKLLSNLGGKVVSVVFKNPKSGIPMMNGILLDEDEAHYYLGENLEISVAVRKVEVQIIMDATIPMREVDEGVPPGTKFQ